MLPRWENSLVVRHHRRRVKVQRPRWCRGLIERGRGEDPVRVKTDEKGGGSRSSGQAFGEWRWSVGV